MHLKLAMVFDVLQGTSQEKPTGLKQCNRAKIKIMYSILSMKAVMLTNSKEIGPSSVHYMPYPHGYAEDMPSALIHSCAADTIMRVLTQRRPTKSWIK